MAWLFGSGKAEKKVEKEQVDKEEYDQMVETNEMLRQKLPLMTEEVETLTKNLEIVQKRTNEALSLQKTKELIVKVLTANTEVPLAADFKAVQAQIKVLKSKISQLEAQNLKHKNTLKTKRGAALAAESEVQTALQKTFANMKTIVFSLPLPKAVVEQTKDEPSPLPSEEEMRRIVSQGDNLGQLLQTIQALPRPYDPYEKAKVKFRFN
jgi:hypothetical protein